MRSNAPTAIPNRHTEKEKKIQRAQQSSSGLPAEKTTARKRTLRSKDAKVSLKIATWNVQSATTHAKQVLVSRSLHEHGVDIGCLQETHANRQSSGERMPSADGDDAFVIYGSPAHADRGRSAKVGGVAIAVRQRLLGQTYVAVRRPSESMAHRLIAVDMASSPPVTIICAYAPTEDAETKDDCDARNVKDDFYEEQLLLIAGRPKGNIIMLGGDLNARLAAHRLSSGVGRYTLGAPRQNDNGARMSAMMTQLDLFAVNTWMRQPAKSRATHRSNLEKKGGEKIVLQLDFIVSNRRWTSAWKKIRPTWHTHHQSDHALLIGTFSLRLSTKRRPAPPPVPDARRLATDARVRQQLAQAVTKAYEEGRLDDHAHLASAVTAAALDIAGPKPRRACTWLTARSLDVAAERRHAAPHSQDRRRLTNKLRRAVKRDREEHAVRQAKLLNEAARAGHMRELHQSAKAIGRAMTIPPPAPIAAPMWVAHFQAALGRAPPTAPSPLDYRPPTCPRANIPDGPPTREEVQRALMRSRANKAPGLTGLSSSMLKSGGPAIAWALTGIFEKIWESGAVPEEMRRGAIVPIYKMKGARDACSSYRPIQLLEVASKILSSLITRRLAPLIDAPLHPSQTGFRRGSGTIDAIATVRRLAERAHNAKSAPMLVAYLDFRAAFDSVCRSRVEGALHAAGVPPKLLSIIAAMLTGTTSRVRIKRGHETTDFPTTSGVVQGDAMSPALFVALLDHVLTALDQDRGVLVGDGREAGGRIAAAAYADDIALLAETEADLQPTSKLFCDQVADLAHPLGLSLNAAKCKVQRFGPTAGTPNIIINGEPAETVETFVYLGSTMTTRPSADEEVKKRRGQAWTQMARLSKLWADETVEKDVKMRIFLSHVRPVLTYGLHVIPMTAGHAKSIDSFERRCLRWALSIRYGDGHGDWPTNHELITRVKRTKAGQHYAQPSACVRRARLSWLGHCLRAPVDTIARRALFADALPRRATAGYMRQTWLDTVLDETMAWHQAKPTRANQEGQVHALHAAATDRAGWRNLVHGRRPTTEETSLTRRTRATRR